MRLAGNAALGAIGMAFVLAGCGTTNGAMRGMNTSMQPLSSAQSTLGDSMTPISLPSALLTNDALPTVGQPAPPLTVQTLAGGSVDLASAHGRGVVVVFFASWCPHCQRELPQIEQIWSKMCSCRGLQIMPVDAVDEDAQTLENFRTQFKLKIPVYRDPGSVMTGQWGIQGVPTAFFVDRAGVIESEREGDIATDDLNAQIEAILRYGPGAH